MEPQTIPSAAITRAFSSTRQQLQNALDNLNNQEAFAFSAVTQLEHSSVDEYNAAITQAEEFQAEAESLRVQLHVIKDKQGEFELRALDAEGKLAIAEKFRLAEKARANEAERQLKDLNILNPKRMQNQNKEKTKLLDKQRVVIGDLKESELKLKRTVVELQTQNTNLLKQLDFADTEIKKLNLAHHIGSLHKQYLDQRFYNEDDVKKQRPFYAYLLSDGGNKSATQWIISDLDWKIHIMNCYGEGVTVMYNEWLFPILPPCELSNSVPYEMLHALFSFGLSAIESTHPHLIDRAEWAQGISARDIGISDKLISALKEGGTMTLHDIMVKRQDGIIRDTKGIGEKTATTIFSAAEKYIAENYSKNQEQAA